MGWNSSRAVGDGMTSEMGFEMTDSEVGRLVCEYILGIARLGGSSGDPTNVTEGDSAKVDVLDSSMDSSLELGELCSNGIIT